MFVQINERRCVGCGLCEENHPENFEMGNQFAVVTMPLVSAENEEYLKQTARDCPADAIFFSEQLI